MSSVQSNGNNYVNLLSKKMMQNVPQRNKDLVFGYIRDTFKTIDYLNLPKLISYSCLAYFNETLDKWDSKNVHKSIKINDSNIKRMTDHGYKTAHLCNIVSSGTHIWKFKYIKCGYVDLIGIAAEKKKLDVNHDLEYDRWTRSTFSKSFTNSKSKYSQHIDGNDMVEMKLDFKELTLSYSVNSKGFKKEHDINGSLQYRGAVSLSAKDSEIELICYQHIY